MATRIVYLLALLTFLVSLSCALVHGWNATAVCRAGGPIDKAYVELCMG